MARRGFSYTEMLVAILLLVFLMTISARFLIVSFRLSTEGSLEAAMQSQAVIALHKMVADLQKTPAAVVRQNENGFGAVSMDTLTHLRTLVWSDRLKIYYRDPVARKLWYKEYPPKPPDLPIVFDPSQPPYVSGGDLQLIMDTRNTTERCLASDVESFTLTHRDAVHDVTLVLMAKVRDYRARFELVKTINFRNHL